MKRISLCALVVVIGCDSEPVPMETDLPPAPPPPDAGPLNLDADHRDVPVARDDVGEPCEANEECRSGFCILVRGQERVCTRKCGNDDECPPEWVCLQVTNAGADVTFICVPEDAPCAGADLTSDPEHCGECEHACEYPGAAGVCSEGMCELGDCAPGFHDLDGDPGDGCEYACTETRGGEEACDEIDNDCDGAVDEGIDTANSLLHCGGCGQPCTPANATGACIDGACTIDGCAEGFADADGDVGNGCELGCAPSNGGVEACDNVDNDCDGVVDEGVDVQADPANCGGCGVRCDRANAITGCQDGGCRFVGCADGFFDRNEDPADGCETACARSNGGVEACDEIDNDCDGATDEGIDVQANPVHCGACGVRCDRPNAVTACRGGGCAFDGCVEGFVDLDEDPEDGCEVGCQRSNGGIEACDNVDNDCDGSVDEGIDLSEDEANCGRCGNDCGVPGGLTACRAGQCAFDGCAEGFHDIDGAPENGCEYACVGADPAVEACNEGDDDCDGAVDEGFDLDDDADNCGQCARACRYNHAAGLCGAGDCAMGDCEAGWVDLDTRPNNGCEYECTVSFEGVELCDETDNDCDGEADEGIDLLRDANNCGRCRNRCELPNADAVCAQANCRIGECAPGFVDTDREPETGCECELSNEGVEACDESDNDCDGLVDEAFDFENNPEHCGGCDVSCDRDHAQTRCREAGCDLVTCDDGWADVDGRVFNGCEHDCDEDPAPEQCGGVPVDFDYGGFFDVRPKIDFSCSTIAFGMEVPVLDVNVSTIRITDGGENLTAAVLRGRGEAGGALQRFTLQDNDVTNDGWFNFEMTIPADLAFGCQETYRFSGQFVDEDNWVGEFEIVLAGGGCFGCAGQYVYYEPPQDPFSGARIPE